jgi:hypothetical protein
MTLVHTRTSEHILCATALFLPAPPAGPPAPGACWPACNLQLRAADDQFFPLFRLFLFPTFENP